MSKVKSIFQLLTEKPWEKEQIESDNKHEGRTLSLSKQKVGLRTIMVVSTVIFSLFILPKIIQKKIYMKKQKMVYILLVS